MPDTVFLPERIEVTRPIPAPPSVIFDIVRSPAGHVAIDASGMLQDYTGEPAEKVGDTFVIHMDRESLNDFPLGKYDVTVHIITFEQDREIAWNLGEDIGIPHFYGYRLEPGEDGVTNVTSYYDWSLVNGDIKERFPIVPESAFRVARDLGANCSPRSLSVQAARRRYGRRDRVRELSLASPALRPASAPLAARRGGPHSRGQRQSCPIGLPWPFSKMRSGPGPCDGETGFGEARSGG